MTETGGVFTGNSGPDTVSLREWIAKHSDHLDEGIHELAATTARMENMLASLALKVDEMHAELEAARPLIERWQHSKIRKLAAGQMPWTG